MSLAAIILVLISSITHTTWNSISKNFKVSCKSIAIAMTISIIVFFPLFYIVRESFHIIKIFLLPGLLSGFTNALAFWALLAAYRKGDLSFVYPLKNALPILMSIIFAIIIGKGLEITPLAYFGFAIIIIGCILLPIYDIKIIKLDTFFNRAILFTVIAAFGSTVYSTYTTASPWNQPYEGTWTPSLLTVIEGDDGMGGGNPGIWGCLNSIAVVPTFCI